MTFGGRNLWSGGISTADVQLQGSEKARHVSYIPTDYEDGKRFLVFQKVEGLKGRTRTFFPISQLDSGYWIAMSILFELVPDLKRLRVLSLQSYRVTRIPDSISHLKHLRYMNFCHTQIESLPESMCMLYNLQFLILSYCYDLVKLPSTFKYLLKLRHLNLKSSTRIGKMPLGMKYLRNLQYLSDFFVSEDGKGLALM